MAGFSSVKEYVDAEVGGRYRFSTYRKLPQSGPTAVWFDMSVALGHPSPNYYASTPLVSQQLKYSTNRGIYCGDTFGSKFIKSVTNIAGNNFPPSSNIIFCDYLLYYPFIADNESAPQILTNSVSLPRYESGEGVKIIAVSMASRTGNQTFNVTYTNQDGVAGRVTKTASQGTFSTNVGAIITSGRRDPAFPTFHHNPFIALQDGDTGVRSIQSVQMNGLDVGLFALVLVKPIIQTQIFESTAPSEEAYLCEKGLIPEIKDDAYLNFLICPSSGMSGSIMNGFSELIY